MPNDTHVNASNALVATVGFYAGALDDLTKERDQLLRERNDALQINQQVLQQQLTLQGQLLEGRRICIEARVVIEALLKPDGTTRDYSPLIDRIGAWMEATGHAR